MDTYKKVDVFKNISPQEINYSIRERRCFRLFKSIFKEILLKTPLPNGNVWILQTLEKAGLRDNQGWMEVLYRTRAYYQCNHGHRWESSWSMILFRFRLDASTGFGRVRMKRFGLRCTKFECKDDDTYHMGLYDIDQVWWAVQCLLYHIVQRCYEKRRDRDIDIKECIIPASNVPSGRYSGTHPRNFCEACAHNRCQEKYKTLTKKK